MDEFRRGLLLQMGANRDRTRRRREPWLYGTGATVLTGGLVWFDAGLLLACGVLAGGWGLTVFRHSRLTGRERDRLAGQALVVIGLALAGAGLWRTFSRG